MKKGKSIILLSILSVIMAALLVLSFARFPIGIKNYNSFLGAIDLDYDLAGGYAYTCTLSDDNENEIEDTASFIKTVSDRVSALGYGTYSVKAITPTDETANDFKVRIEVKATDNASQDISAVLAYGKLHFYGGTATDSIEEIFEDVEAIKKATYSGASYYEGNAYQGFTVEFTKEAKSELDKLIKGASSYYLKITLGEDGDANAITLLDTTAGSFSIYSDGSNNNAYNNGKLSLSYGSDADVVERMVMQLNKGGIDYIFDLDKIESATVTAPLGDNFANIAVIVLAGLIVLALIIITVKNRGFGLVSLFSMIIFVTIYLFLFIAIPGITVNVGGIVGALLSIILTVFGILVSLKKINEDYASGKTVKAAFKNGFKRALVPVISSFVIALLVSIFTFVLTGGIVKNFAIALAIGSLLGAFVVLLIFRMFSALLLPLAKPERQEKFFGLKREDD